MYFDFEDYRPDIVGLTSAISWREGVLLSIIFHLVMIIVMILSPRIFMADPAVARARAAALEAQRERDNAQFVFMAPNIDTPARKPPPPAAPPSDQDRLAQAPQKAPEPKNDAPLSRGNTRERVQEQPAPASPGQGPAPDPAAGQQADSTPPPSNSALQFPRPLATPNGASGRGQTPGGALGDALKNLQRYVQTYDNPEGGGGQYGPEIQFDSKGVEFGPWIRRFIAQVKRNWYPPYITSSGHVVITFNVHRDGALTDITVVGPCPIDAFNNSAFAALASSNPTQPLPPAYPSDKAFFTVTFFYNEAPPQ